MEFYKICKNPRCKKNFVTTVRTQGYCCEECRNKHYKERTKRRKTYKVTEAENRLLSKVYRIANEIADIFYPEKVCCKCGAKSTHVHHIDVNPLNNHPANLMRLCDKCHKQIHTELPDINMVTTLHDCNEAKKENPALDAVKMFEAKFKE